MQNFLGHRKYVNSRFMKDEYFLLAERNKKSAVLLEEQGFYNEAIYMYIQSMEKQIKGYICGKINSSNPYFSKKLRDIGHSLDLSIDFLIEILAGNNNVLKEQLTLQLKKNVFQDINFSIIYNSCRYPSYNFHKQNYSILYLDKKDCQKVASVCEKLNDFISDFDRL